jgi:CheY-like chemotaxis protein
VSLSGSIEDLPLLEILQVVSFCQKTGHLVVRAPEGEAGIVFHDGRVVAGYAWDLPPFAEAVPDREARLRSRLDGLLGRLVRLREGEFAFNLTERVPVLLEGRDLEGETLEDGINPEGLMLDLARQLDEERRDCAAALQASFATPADTGGDAAAETLPAPPEPEAEPSATPGYVAAEPPPVEDLPAEDLGLEELPAEDAATIVLLVDDEPEVCRVVGDRLRREGLAVRAAPGADEARRLMARLSSAGRPLVLAVDLGLPSESGTTFRGGLDVVRHASALRPPPPVLLMVETIDEKLRGRARRLGVSMLAFKPWLSKLDPLQYEADLRAFGDKLARDLVPRLAGRPPALAPVAPALSALPPAASEPREEALRRALEEIEAHPDPDLVAFALMRAARAFFPRAALFVPKDDRLRGLAGFGPAASGDSLDRLARELVVPLESGSPFGQVMATGRAWQGEVPAGAPLRALVERIGAFEAREVALVPLRALHETIAVLYGDAPDGSALPPVATFADFVEQAGRALEETLALRRSALAAAS